MLPPKFDPSPAGRLRARGVVFTVEPFARLYFCEKSFTSGVSWNSGLKEMSEATVFCQISIVFVFPLSASSYWARAALTPSVAASSPSDVLHDPQQAQARAPNEERWARRQTGAVAHA